MANIKSAKKRILTSRKSALLNNEVRTSMKTSMKNVEKNLQNKEEATTKLALAIKKIDKAASKGVIKKNTANRYKANLTKKVNKND